ncbi:MAG: hypothetical protein KGI37_08525 [Alphaproteobacteria bacterium]|nr:hypothetical protein [Alphaproteobacteria bacterium]
MTDLETPDTATILATLNLVMQSSDSDTSRIQAAKILLERLAPKEDDETRRREADERRAALDDARGLLAEFAAVRLAGLCEPDALAESGAPATDHAAGE